jgi:hypothetical protein
MNAANVRSIRRLAFAAIATLAAGAALAAPQLQTIEECLESGTRAVSLPGIASGSVTASPCAGCPSLRLRVDAKTRFFIGKDQVAYARFREAAAKGDLRLDLYYEPKSRTLNRVRLATASAAK